jgi:plasmid stabilization system protein ParE
MTSQLEITPEAERDIFAIAANIHQQVSFTASKRMILEIKNQLNTLAESADGGRIGGCEGTREVVMTGMPYIAVYEKSDTLVTIVRVLYGANERKQGAR